MAPRARGPRRIRCTLGFAPQPAPGGETSHTAGAGIPDSGRRPFGRQCNTTPFLPNPPAIVEIMSDAASLQVATRTVDPEAPGPVRRDRPGSRPRKVRSPGAADPNGPDSRTGSDARSGMAGRLARRLLEVPLFFKLTVANAAVVVGSAVLSLVLAAAVLGDGASLSGVVEVVGVAGGAALLAAVGVNVVLTRLALSPLQRLEEAARRAGAGDLGVRVPPSPLADRDLRQLVDVFNGMLDSLESSARHRRRRAAALLDAEERARSQVSRELYQDLAQQLAALLLALGPNGERGLREELAAALEKVREVARRLRPPELDELGLVPALEAETRVLRERGGGDVRVQEPAIEPALEPEVRLALFRILQEALVNAVRHAEADTVRLRLRTDGPELVAEVEDDGRGFDADTMLGSDDAAPGLRGMTERARYVGGRVEVESEPEAGTRVRVRVPGGSGAGSQVR